MNKTSKQKPKLSLSVQYAKAEPRLPRWRLRAWIQRALYAAHDDLQQSFAGAHLSIRLVGLPEAQSLNHAYRKKDYATNVLTFAYGEQPDGIISGDIVICLPVLQREAKEQGKKFLAHAAHLTLHGTLHALGYDHLNAREAKHMESIETKILAKIGIHDPYLAP
jgi:probable rRNA maturation factor